MKNMSCMKAVARVKQVIPSLVLILLVILISNTMLALTGRSEVEVSKAWLQHYSDSVEPRSYEQEVDSAREALTLAKQFNEFDPRYSESLRRISEIYVRNDEFEAAEPFLLQEMEVLKKFGPGFPDLDFDLYWLAVLNERRGKILEARRMHEEALRIALTLRKNAEPEVFHIYGHLAALALYEHDFKKAAEYRQNAVNYVFDTAMKDEHISSGAQSLRMNLEDARNELDKINPNLAGAYLQTIIECAKTAVAVQKVRAGRDNLAYNDLRNELAYMMTYFLDDEGALELYRKGLEFLQTKYPYEKRRIGTVAAHLSVALTALHRESESTKYLMLAFDNFDNPDFSPENKSEWLRYPTNYLVGLLRKRGNIPEVVRILERLLTIGNDRSSHSKTRERLAEAYRQLGDGEFAEKRFASAAQAYEKSIQHYRQCAPHCLECFETMEELGHTYLIMGQLRKAESCLDEVAYGPDASNRRFVIWSLKRRALFDLSIIASQAGRQPLKEYTDARVTGDALYRDAITDLEREAKARAGNNVEVANAHTKLWQSHFSHAKTLAREGRIKEAADSFKLGLPYYLNVVGASVDYFRLGLQYIDWLLTLKQYQAAESVAMQLLLEGREASGLEFPKYVHFLVDDLKQIYKATSRLDREKAISVADQIRVFKEVLSAKRCVENGCYASAARIYNTILEEDEVVFGARSDVARSDLYRAAEYSFFVENYKEAERYAKRYLEFFFKANEATCNMMNLLADLYNRTGRANQAERLLVDRIIKEDFQKEVLKPRIKTLYTLATSLYLQDRNEEAARQIELARKSCKAPLLIAGDGMPSILSPLREKNLEIEERILTEELTLYRQIRSDYNAACSELNVELGNCYAKKKEFKSASEKFEEAHLWTKLSNNRDRFLELRILTPWEESLRSQGRIGEADNLLARLNRQLEHCK